MAWKPVPYPVRELSPEKGKRPGTKGRSEQSFRTRSLNGPDRGSPGRWTLFRVYFPVKPVCLPRSSCSRRIAVSAERQAGLAGSREAWLRRTNFRRVAGHRPVRDGEPHGSEKRAPRAHSVFPERCSHCQGVENPGKIGTIRKTSPSVILKRAGSRISLPKSPSDGPCRGGSRTLHGCVD